MHRNSGEDYTYKMSEESDLNSDEDTEDTESEEDETSEDEDSEESDDTDESEDSEDSEDEDSEDESDDESEDSSEDDETPKQLKKRLAKAEQLAENQRIRAEKAERKLKGKGKPAPGQKSEQSSNLSPQDTVAIIRAEIAAEDINDVVEFAKFKKISVTEALKSSILKAALAEKAEKRNTGNATNTGKHRPGSRKPSGSSLLKKAQTSGEIPSDDESMDALLEARSKERTKRR